MIIRVVLKLRVKKGLVRFTIRMFQKISSDSSTYEDVILA